MKLLESDEIELHGGGSKDGLVLRRLPNQRPRAEIIYAGGLSAMSPEIQMCDHYHLRRLRTGRLRYEYTGRW